MVGSDRTNPKGYERALVEAIVQESGWKKSTVLPFAACVYIQKAAGDESERVRSTLLWNEAQLHFVSLRSWAHCGGRGGLSRVEMNALRAPLTALPAQPETCVSFSVDTADAFIDGRITRHSWKRQWGAGGRSESSPHHFPPNRPTRKECFIMSPGFVNDRHDGNYHRTLTQL
jgi:hypothetical protein